MKLANVLKIGIVVTEWPNKKLQPIRCSKLLSTSLLFFNAMMKILGHLKTVLIHKYWVFYYANKLGIPWQGFIHDFSKFSLVELKESIRYYQGGKSSPIPAVKKKQGYSLAWQHHKGRNPHHYEYWTDNYDSGTTTIKMPFKYVLEMIADYLAAGRTYNGPGFTFKDEYNWWLKCKDVKKMDPETKNLVTFILKTLATQINGLDVVFSHIEQLEKQYNNNKPLTYYV